MKPLITTAVLAGFAWLCAGSPLSSSQSADCNNHTNCTESNNNTPFDCKHGSVICRTGSACSINEDCPVDKACVDHTCQDPCLSVDCGLNSACRVSKHLSMCACAPGYMGDPFTGCVLISPPECTVNHMCPVDSACINHKCMGPCTTHRCGTNAECRTQDHLPQCSCVSGYIGDATSECILNKKVEPSRVTLATKKFYVDTRSKVSWHDALGQCKSRGYRLASILSDSENEQVLRLIKDTGVRYSVFWTSGSDRSKERNWVWDTTGESISGFSYWQKYQPNNFFNQDCLGYHEVSNVGKIFFNSGYRWNDIRCNKKSNFICEYYE